MMVTAPASRRRERTARMTDLGRAGIDVAAKLSFSKEV